MRRSNNLVWIDLEMTGLNPEQDVIIEIATIITDSELNVVVEGPTIVIHQSEINLSAMNTIVRQMHKKNGLLDEVRISTIPLEEAETLTYECIQRYCYPNSALLAGNSVWMDKMFLRRYMPRIFNFLYYRIIDVSTVRELITRWYPNNPNIEFAKKDTHRAVGDIRESIAELRHYRSYFFIPQMKSRYSK